MVNPGEALVNAVSDDKPKRLTGLDQKVRGQVRGSELPSRRCCTTGGEARPNPPRYIGGTW